MLTSVVIKCVEPCIVTRKVEPFLSLSTDCTILFIKVLWFIRGCHRQPLILFSFADYVVWLHVTERYVYIYSASYNIQR